MRQVYDDYLQSDDSSSCGSSDEDVDIDAISVEDLRDPIESSHKPRYTRVEEFEDPNDNSSDESDGGNPETAARSKADREHDYRLKKLATFILQNLKVVFVAFNQKITFEQFL